MLMVAALGWLFYGSAFVDAPSTTTDNTTFSIERADTIERQTKGLSGRSTIPANYGMLFVFPTAERRGFWMKDMSVPIDIIWLSDNGKILGIEDSVSPNTYPDVFYPPVPVRYVLETRGGESKMQGWEIGTTIPIYLQD